MKFERIYAFFKFVSHFFTFFWSLSPILCQSYGLCTIAGCLQVAVL